MSRTIGQRLRRALLMDAALVLTGFLIVRWFVR